MIRKVTRRPGWLSDLNVCLLLGCEGGPRFGRIALGATRPTRGIETIFAVELRGGSPSVDCALSRGQMVPHRPRTSILSSWSAYQPSRESSDILRCQAFWSVSISVSCEKRPPVSQRIAEPGSFHSHERRRHPPQQVPYSGASPKYDELRPD